MARFRHVFHATDFSPASAKAFRIAVELARADRAPLTVVHVLAPLVAVVGDGNLPPTTYAQLEATTRAAARKQLDRLVRRAKAARVRATGLLLSGPPHEQIVRALKSRRAGVAVIGTHGRTGLARLFLGSVAARVVALAPCPVLTVRGR